MLQSEAWSPAGSEKQLGCSSVRCIREGKGENKDKTEAKQMYRVRKEKEEAED